MKTLEQILNNLSDEQKQLLADTIIYGGWGDSEVKFQDDEDYGYGYVTNDAHKGGHFNRRELSRRFQDLFKALNLEGSKWAKCTEEMAWFHDWWCDGSGSVLFIRSGLDGAFEKWARTYNNCHHDL